MIDLSNSSPFSEGGNRKCFLHPDHKDKCIKIIKEDVFKEKLKSLPWYKKFRRHSTFNDNFREEKGYQQPALQNKSPEVWKHLAKWYGFEETNLGLGAVTELILDNGQIAKTLESYLLEHGITPELKVAIKNFHTWLREYLVLTKNILPHNIVLKQDKGELVLVIIDGLGSKALLPFPNYSKFFAKRYVERRIQLMSSRIDWDLRGREGSWK